MSSPGKPQSRSGEPGPDQSWEELLGSSGEHQEMFLPLWFCSVHSCKLKEESPPDELCCSWMEAREEPAGPGPGPGPCEGLSQELFWAHCLEQLENICQQK